MTRLKWLALVAAVASIAACASAAGKQAAAARPRTMVEVDNQALADMNIYLVRGGQRIRLGMATGLSKTQFTIPQGIVFGSTSLRFMADPVGGRATPVSEEITVVEGEVVVLRIPPGAG
jgi:hypothetical protein